MNWVLKFTNIVSGIYTLYLIVKEICPYIKGIKMRWLLQYSASIAIVLIFIGSGIILIYQRHLESKKAKTEGIPEKEPSRDMKDINNLILFQIVKLRSSDQKATPRNIANQLNQNAEIILSYLWKLHNDKFVTFQTGGLPSTLDTDFYLMSWFSVKWSTADFS
jgi:hypothetical protein